MSWNAIVSGTTFDALTVSATASSRSSADRHHGDVRLDRRERVVRGLGGDAGQRGEQRRLAGVGHADDPDLHRQILRERVAEHGAGEHVARIVDAEVRPADRERAGGRVQRTGAGSSRRYARAAANEVVAWALGNESWVTIGVRGGRSGSSGRRRRTTNLIAWLSP